MMTTHEDPAETSVKPVSTLQMNLAGLTAMLFASASAGVAAGTLEKGLTNRRAAMLAAVVTLTMAAGWWALRTWRQAQRADEPVAPRVRRARRILNLAMAAGLVSGFVLGVLHGADILHGGHLLAGPLSPINAALLIAFTLAMAPLTWAWYRSVDELEVRAYNEGASAALHVFSFAAPVWWLAARAGFVPEPHGLAIYLFTMAVWGVVWLWRRPR